MKETTINIPSNINGFRIEHFKGLALLDGIKDPKRVRMSQKIAICSAFTGVPEEDFEYYTPISVERLWFQILRVLDTYHPRPIPSQIQYEGQIYEFIKDMKKLPVAWFVDVSVTDFKEQPERLASFCYLEKGMGYAKRDENLNILNPLSERDRIFKEEMPLNRYIDLSSFFLRLYLRLMPYLMSRGISVNQELARMQKDLNRMLGTIQSMESQRNTE